MKKTLQFFLKLGLSVGLFMMFGLTAFAASVYTVDQATATVGTAQNYEIEYTVDTGLQTWADADTITVTLPNNFPDWSALTFTAENDADVANDGVGETAIGVGAGAGQYAIVGKVLTIQWNLTGWGPVGNGVETIRVLVTGGLAPTYAGASSTVTFGGTTAAADTDPSGTDTVNVSAADAVASLALATDSAGASTTATLTLTISSDLANTDTITFTAPAFLDVSGVDAATNVTGTIEAGGGAITCAVSGQVVTCTTDGVITAATGTLIFAAGEISGAYVDAGTTDITDLAVNRVSGAAGGADINSDATVDVPAITVGDLTSTNVAPESLSLSTISPTTFTFTTTAAIPTGATLVVVYPAGWNLAGAAGQVGSALSGLTGTWTATVSSQTLTLTKTGGSSDAAGAKSLTLNGIMTPPNEGSGGTYSITSTTSAPANIETDATVTADTIIGKVASSIVVGTPTGVTVTDNAGGGVLITWVDPSGSTDATKDIKIMKGTAPMPVDGAQYALVLKGVQKYVDTNVQVGDVVSYQLRASNGAGDTGATTAAVTFTVGSTIIGEPAIEPVTVDLTAVGESGQSGTATLTEADGAVTVEVVVNDPDTDTTGTTQQAHIHSGTCTETGDIAYVLTDLVDGTSTTVLDGVTLAELKANGASCMKIHDATDPTVIVASGVVYPAEEPTPEEVAPPEVTVPEVTLDETGTVVAETTVKGENETAYATISAGTTLTIGDAPATSFMPPTVKPEVEVTPPEGAEVASDVYSIGSGEEGVTITASQPVTVYLPVKAGFVADTLKVYQAFKLDSDESSGTATVVTSDGATLFRVEFTSFSDYVILAFAAEEEEEEAAEEEEEEEEEVAEAPFTDTKTHWSKDYVADLYAKGIVSGKTTTKYAPDDAVTRAEFTKIIVGAFGIDLVSTTGSFTDISGHWGAKYIEAAKAAGVISGYSDKTFKPDAQINRAEALKILLEAADVSLTAAAADFPDVKASDWFAKYVNYAAANEIVKGYADGTFGPNKSITRGEVAKVVSLMIAE